MSKPFKNAVIAIGNFDGVNINNAVHVVRDSDYGDRIYIDGSYQNSFGNWVEVRLSSGDDIVEFTGITGTARIS